MCTDHRIIEILGLRPSNRLPVSYQKYVITSQVTSKQKVNGKPMTQPIFKADKESGQ